MLLFFIFLVAFILRIAGTNPGYVNHPDEPKIADAALNITFHFNFEPVAFYYGSLLPIVYALFNFVVVLPLYFLLYVPFNTISSLISQGDLGIVSCFLKSGVSYCLGSESREFLFYLTRYETALLSSFSVVLIYHLGKKLFCKSVGLLAAVFTATNYRHVLSSHFSLADAPLTVFIILSLFLNLRLLQRRSLGNYFLAGLGLGLVFSVKYFVYTIPAFFLCHTLASLQIKGWRNKVFALLDRKIIVSLVVAFVVFAAINPYVFLDYQNAKEQFALNAMFYRTSSLSLQNFLRFDKIPFYSLYYLFKFGLGELVSIVTILGFVVSIVKYPKSTLLLSSVVLLFFYSFLVISGATYVRNFSAVLPIVTMFAAVFVKQLVKNMKVGRMTLILLLCLLLYSQVKNTFVVSLSFSQVSNYKLLENWILDMLPDSSKVEKSWGTPFPGRKQVDLKEWAPYSTSYMSLSELINSETDYLIFSTRSGVYVNDSLNIASRNDIVGQSFFNSRVFWGFLENNYVSLLTRELGSYRVKEFVKLEPALDPSFAVIKIPRFPENFKILSGVESAGTIRPVCFDFSKSGKQNVTKFGLLTSPVIPGVLYKVSADTLIVSGVNSSYRSKFLRADFISARGVLLKTYVSRQTRSIKEWEELLAFGIAPEGASVVSVSLQTDECAKRNDEEYQIKNVLLFQSTGEYALDVETYPYFNTPLSRSFIWLPPL